MDIPTPAAIVARFTSMTPDERTRLARHAVHEFGSFAEGTYCEVPPPPRLTPYPDNAPIGWWDAKAAAHAVLNPARQDTWWRRCDRMKVAIGFTGPWPEPGMVRDVDLEALDLAESALLAAMVRELTTPRVLRRLLAPWTAGAGRPTRAPAGTRSHGHSGSRRRPVTAGHSPGPPEPGFGPLV